MVTQSIVYLDKLYISHEDLTYSYVYFFTIE